MPTIPLRARKPLIYAAALAIPLLVGLAGHAILGGGKAPQASASGAPSATPAQASAPAPSDIAGLAISGFTLLDLLELKQASTANAVVNQQQWVALKGLYDEVASLNVKVAVLQMGAAAPPAAVPPRTPKRKVAVKKAEPTWWERTFPHFWR